MTLTHYNFLENTKPRKEDFEGNIMIRGGGLDRMDEYQKALDFYEYRENGPDIPWKSFEDEEPMIPENRKSVWILVKWNYGDHSQYRWTERGMMHTGATHWADLADRQALQSEWQKHRYLGGENEIYKGWKVAVDYEYNYVIRKENGRNVFLLEFSKINDTQIFKYYYDGEEWWCSNGVHSRSEFELIISNRM